MRGLIFLMALMLMCSALIDAFVRPPITRGHSKLMMSKAAEAKKAEKERRKGLEEAAKDEKKDAAGKKAEKKEGKNKYL